MIPDPREAQTPASLMTIAREAALKAWQQAGNHGYEVADAVAVAVLTEVLTYLPKERSTIMGLVAAFLPADLTLSSLAVVPPETTEEKHNDLACLDCGKPYKEFPLDLLFPRGQWLQIHPSEGGILCANCMIARAATLPGAVVVHGVVEILTSGNSLKKEPDYFTVPPAAQTDAPHLQFPTEVDAIIDAVPRWELVFPALDALIVAVQRAALPPPRRHGGDWRPIESAAQKVHERVLLWWTTRGACSGYFDVDEDRNTCGWRGDQDLVIPRDQAHCTHWMPLPPSPEESK